MRFWWKREPRDYVMLNFGKEYRLREVLWTAGGPFTRPYPSLEEYARLFPGGRVDHKYITEYIPTTQRILNWSEVTGRCLGIERKSA